MSTFKRTKVKLLESDNPHAPIGIDGEGTIHPSNPFCDSYHMYFLSDDEIKEGDWVYFDDGDRKGVTQAKNADEVNAVTCIDSWRIIATTDKLPINVKPYGVLGGATYDYLAEPSQGFIKKFVEKGGIWEVVVEYEETKECDCYYRKFCKSHSLPKEVHCERFEPKLYLKVSSDNTITIRPVKDSWSREELMEATNKLPNSYKFIVRQFIKENL